MSKDFERRLDKIEAAIGKPEKETVIIIVSWASGKDVQHDYPECPGLEAQIEETRKNRQPGAGAIIVFCHSDCSRECRESGEHV